VYKLGTADVWWRVARDNPDLVPNKKQVLKPLGYAFVIDQIRRLGSQKKVLEIGHGSSSLLFEIFAESIECWGIDGDDRENTVNRSALNKLRANMPNVRFVEGFVGESDGLLPDDYFDLACSISVVEHIPKTEIPSFFNDLFRILTPGGIHIHSFDVWWMQDTRYMFEAIESAGFEWLEPREQMTVYWENWLKPYSQTEMDPKVWTA
jgi:ubiquinone/menaquinone biosynthesis C-methylase UbiE